ncbi:MAG: 16S rRNA (guanine(527)-N(7))-methyltransferase RsmG [Gammaproteobacteria bacterium]|jgi:16S rRNA (guanine527-N7)-methyltransferase|nr:16S rRNA (guanine(527)-N(7))-methyltransferase RsmG [Gammaproteobacteria bacterium]MBT4494589.1 16S rRNA (guanine(527)-N(7))-methyltransferase RsmG [Gammaproteobacteria bacterium]MBT7371748.1 16S rRNA (guanine(527)-N(7))-methyltransferase RsmG [Gammaproteobacteria bacterium]
MEADELLKSGLGELEIPASDTLMEKALHYKSLLMRWNRVTNLTAILESEKITSHHLLDAFSITSFLKGSRILDVGSGAGLPGIPLALINPDKDFILLDSNGKKTRFMTQVKIELGLDNVEVIQARVEDFEGSFDQVLSRAFASLADFVSSSRHLATSGNLLAMKGLDLEEELEALDSGSVEVNVHKFSVPGIETERCLVELKVATSA